MELLTEVKVKAENPSLYYSLLKEEDYDFKTKDISITPFLDDQELRIEIFSPGLLEFKIGSNAVHKSLRIIEGTLETVKNESV